MDEKIRKTIENGPLGRFVSSFDQLIAQAESMQGKSATAELNWCDENDPGWRPSVIFKVVRD